MGPSDPSAFQLFVAKKEAKGWAPSGSQASLSLGPAGQPCPRGLDL